MSTARDLRFPRHLHFFCRIRSAMLLSALASNRERWTSATNAPWCTQQQSPPARAVLPGGSPKEMSLWMRSMAGFLAREHGFSGPARGGRGDPDGGER